MGKSEVSNYVGWYEEHLRDGHESGAKIFGNKQDALDWFGGFSEFGNYEFKLFELGKEIPIKLEAVEEPQPPKVKKKWKVI